MEPGGLVDARWEGEVTEFARGGAWKPRATHVVVKRWEGIWSKQGGLRRVQSLSVGAHSNQHTTQGRGVWLLHVFFQNTHPHTNK